MIIINVQRQVKCDTMRLNRKAAGQGQSIEANNLRSPDSIVEEHFTNLHHAVLHITVALFRNVAYSRPFAIDKSIFKVFANAKEKLSVHQL